MNWRGQAKFSNGTVAFQQYEPFRVDMDSTFKIDGGLVRFDRLDLASEGADTAAARAAILAAAERTEIAAVAATGGVARGSRASARPR